MGLFRFVALLLLLWIGWFLVRNQLARYKQERKAAKRKQLESARMVKCHYCEVHIPENSALQAGKEWFCNQAHRQAWLEKH